MRSGNIEVFDLKSSFNLDPTIFIVARWPWSTWTVLWSLAPKMKNCSLHDLDVWQGCKRDILRHTSANSIALWHCPYCMEVQFLSYKIQNAFIFKCEWKLQVSMLLRMERPEEAIVDADRALQCNHRSTKVMLMTSWRWQSWHYEWWLVMTLCRKWKRIEEQKAREANSNQE